jgi:hypothetical protein
MRNKPEYITANDLRSSYLVIGSVARVYIKSISIKLTNNKYTGTITISPLSSPVNVGSDCMLIIEPGKPMLCICYDVRLSDPKTREAIQIIPKDEPVTLSIEFESIRTA